MVRTSIIILSYNTKVLLHECLSALFTTISTRDSEVIVVDNASTDDSVLMLEKEFPQVQLIRNKDNKGFAAGCNIGAKKAKGQYLLFLNSDAMLKQTNIGEMIAWLEQHQDTGIVGGALRGPDGKAQRSYGSFYTLGSVARMLIGGDAAELRSSHSREPKEVDWVSGGFMLMRKEIFDTINGFDEHFFMYIEDMELCYRVRKLGYTVVFFPAPYVIHMGQGSSNRAFAIEQIYRGLRYFYKKHRSFGEYIVLNILLDSKAVALIVGGYLLRNHTLAKTYRKALLAMPL